MGLEHGLKNHMIWVGTLALVLTGIPLANYVSSLSLHFLICKMRIILHMSLLRINWFNAYQLLNT